MKDHELDAFIRATSQAFAGMVELDVTPSSVSRDSTLATGFDVSAVISLSQCSQDGGDCLWSVVLSFPEEIARALVARLLGEVHPGPLDENVADGIGELANVLIGAAKRDLKSEEVDACAVSLPTVILGAKHRVFRLRDLECSTVSFASELGGFTLQIFSRVTTLVEADL